MTDPTRLDDAQARCDATNSGRWISGQAPGPDHEGTPAQWIAEALTGDRPLSVVWCADPQPEYDVATVLTALTGDGPRAAANAEFIAHARTDLPALVQAVRAVLELHEYHAMTVRGVEHHCLYCMAPWPCLTVRAIRDAGIEVQP